MQAVSEGALGSFMVGWVIVGLRSFKRYVFEVVVFVVIGFGQVAQADVLIVRRWPRARSSFHGVA